MRRTRFCLFILAMMVMELGAPLAYADTNGPNGSSIEFAPPNPSPSPNPAAATATPNPATPPAPTAAAASARTSTGAGGVCQIHSMSDAERNQLQQFLFNSNGGFSADNLNDLSDLEALAQTANPPTDPFSAARKAQNAKTPNPNDVDLKAILGLCGEEKLTTDQINQWAQRSGFWDYNKNQLKNSGQITEAQAVNLCSGKNGGSPSQQVMKQISDYFAQLTNSKEQKKEDKAQTALLQPYERYKIILPGSGKEISLADVFQSTKIDPDSCLLKNEVINGRVGYIAILDSDITYGTKNTQLLSGTYVSPATGKATPELISERGGQPVNQHIYGSSMVGFLNLNGGANLIVPEFYRDWIVFSYSYTKIDFYTSMLTSLLTLGAIKNLESVRKVKQDTLANVKTRDPGELFKNDIANQISGAIERDAAGHELVKTPFRIGPSGGLQGGTVASIAIEDTAAGKILVYYDKAGTPIKQVAGVETVEAAIKIDPSLTLQRQGGLIKDLEEADFNINSMKKLKATTDSRVASSFMLAGGWLGPARMMFSLNDGILFQARNQNDDKFLRLLANKKVLADFKQASGFLALGKIQEFIAKYAGFGLVPEKAFYAKNLLLLNYPTDTKSQNLESTTAFRSQDDGSVGISTRWTGSSYTLNYEDMRTFNSKQGPDTITSLDMVSNNIIPLPELQDKNLHSLTSLFSLAIPWIASRRIFELQERSLGAGIFLTTMEYLDINENIGKDVSCDKTDYEQFKTKYRLAFAGSVATSMLTAFKVGFKPLRDYLRQTDLLSSLFSGFLDLTDAINPAEMWRFYIGNQAIAYTSNCKDQMNTILTWQPIPDVVSTKSTNALDKLPAVQEQIAKIGLSKILGSNQEQAQAAAQVHNLKEVLNLRAVLTNQGGQVVTPELLYIHIDQSTSSIKGGLYDLVNNACGLQDRLESKDGRSLTFGNGLEANNADGTKAFSFQSDIWKLRAMARNRIQALHSVVIPNTIILGTLSDTSDTFLDIAGSGQSTLVNPPCDLDKHIFDLTGRHIGSDFTQAIGTVREVMTSDGQADLLNGQIDFVGRNGIGVSVPTPEELRNSISTGGRISIHNNGQVILYGAQDSSQKPLGTLVSIIGDSGAVHFNPSNKQIAIIIYSIFQTSAQNIQSWNLTPKGNGAAIQVQAKNGFEDQANKLNAGLDKITGTGLNSFTTADHTYYITPDGKLRVIDNKTGKAIDYNITGKPYQDANGNLVVPTDKGPFTFNVGNQNGQPTLTAQGPNGLNDLGALLTARGQNGILTFNPSTGAINVYNGQDTPMNPAFGTQGIGIGGNGGGTSAGTPADSPFLAPPTSGSSSTDTASPKLFLPSWPDQWPWAALMAGFILFGVVAIRFRKEDE